MAMACYWAEWQIVRLDEFMASRKSASEVPQGHTLGDGLRRVYAANESSLSRGKMQDSTTNFQDLKIASGRGNRLKRLNAEHDVVRN
jgi:hypothetical protein